jgi:hypothetical protein
MSLKGSRYHCTLSLSTRDTLEVLHAKPEGWRRVSVATSRVGPSGKDPLALRSI